MNSAKKGTIFLKDFKDFIAFLQNMWSILASISILFPLSNILFKIIPLQTLDNDGVFIFFSPILITTMATLITLFVILLTFSKRNTLKTQVERNKIQKQALISFFIGLLAILTYLVLYYVVLSISYSVWGWESDDPRNLFTEVPLFAAYSIFFAMITRAFMLLGMAEFFEQES